MPSSDPAEIFAARAAFVPGSTIAWGLLDRGEIVVGSTDPEHDPVRYQIGSVTKVMTGSLLAVLAGRGTVGLETRIGDILGLPLPKAVAEITLVEIATHTAGLPRLPASMQAPDPGDPYASFDRDALRGFVAELQTGAIVDGRGSFDYSNFGVALLGALLAVAAGRPYEQLLSEELFVPLGMEDTFVATPDEQRLVPRGMNADSVRVPSWTFGAFAPAGGVVSNVADLLAFALALLHGSSPLARALRAATVPQHVLSHGPTVGLCWMCDDALRWHNGQTFGHHAMLAVDTDERRAAVALWNAAYPLDDICFHLLRPERALTQLPVEVALDSGKLASYAGAYEAPNERRLVVAADGGSLFVDDGGGLHCRLYPRDARTFFAKCIPEYTFTFDVSPEGQVFGVAMRHDPSGSVYLSWWRR